MNNLANKTTFWSFLKQTEIRVPIIQRDYAQGRKGKEALRENFLSSIKEALSENSQLKLDFVYGSGDGEGHFLPLDGQQRLTTLWLLHWYFAYKTGELQKPEVQSVLDRFSYQTRESSKAFTHKLVTEGMKINQSPKENIADAILRQSWMFSLWRQDPTVQSMLRMLSGENNEKTDGIEEMFRGESNDIYARYWDKLMSDSGTCPVIFYQLDIENMGQSDDLYVKMNGRGKPLTDFENFKADLLKYFEDMGWTDLSDVTTGYPYLLDTQWTDFFWNYRKKEIEFDDIYFGFINRYFLTVLMRNVPDLEKSEKGTKKRKVYEYLYSFIESKDKRPSFTEIGFGLYKDFFDLLGDKCIVHNMFANLKLVLTNISSYQKSHQSLPVNSSYYNGKCFSSVYVDDESAGKKDFYSLTQPQMIAFWAVCYYFERASDTFCETSLRHWMRLVWNICDFNTEIRDRASMISAINDLGRIVVDPTDPYKCLSKSDYLKGVDKDKYTVFQEHIKEEQVKINKFSEGNYTGTIVEFKGKTWEEVITSVEKHHILCGTIRCLLLDNNGDYVWDDFDTKYKNLLYYGGLGDIAARNYLIYDYDRIQYYWYPEDCLDNSKFWRTLLSERKNCQNNNTWLLATPRNDKELKAFAAEKRKAGRYNYEQQIIIGSSILKDVADKRGLKLATSGVCGGKHVLMHHQASMPYVVMYESRNINILKFVDSGLIKLSSPEDKLKVGMMNGKDVSFIYNEKTYVWAGDGKVRHQEVDTKYGAKIKDEVLSKEDFEAFLSSLPKCNPDPQ